MRRQGSGGRTPVRGVLLDFYGTLVAEDDHVVEAICGRVRATARRPESVTSAEVGSMWWSAFQDKVARSHGGSFLTQRQVAVASLAETLGRVGSAADAEELCQPQFAYWGRPEPLADARSFLDALEVPVCVVSNIDRADLEAALAHTGLRFDHIVTSGDVRSYKPRPECFRAGLDRLGLSREQVVHVGDSLSGDVAGANGAGIPVAWINRRARALPPHLSVAHDLPDLGPLAAIVSGGS